MPIVQCYRIINSATAADGIGLSYRRDTSSGNGDEAVINLRGIE